MILNKTGARSDDAVALALQYKVDGDVKARYVIDDPIAVKAFLVVKEAALSEALPQERFMALYRAGNVRLSGS